MTDFFIIAHTGCNGTRPNTIHSLLAGREWGADVCEVDLRSTRDGQVVLYHDAALPNGKHIADLSLKELLQEKAERICTLHELCKVAKQQNIWLNLDIKDDRSVPFTVRIIQEYRLQDSVFFTGCESLRAQNVKALLPEARVFLNIPDFPPAVSRLECVRSVCAAAAGSCCGLNLPYALYSEMLQDYAQKAGLWVWVWTIEKDFHLFTAAQGITSNHVRELAAFRKSLHKL